MIPILSTQEIKALEAAADAQGISYLRLMENAGSACAKTIRTRFDKTDKRKVVVLCGKGKNGGDGFVAARKLQENGYDVRVLLTCGSPTAENAQEMFERLTELEIPVDPYDAASDRQHARLQEADILIDAVFGTGFSGILPESLQELFSFLRTCKGYVVSIDLPSGLSADTNEVESGAVYADLTISVMALKKALVCAPAKDHAGEVEVVSIGVPKELYAPYDKLVTFTEKEMADWFPARDQQRLFRQGAYRCRKLRNARGGAACLVGLCGNRRGACTACLPGMRLRRGHGRGAGKGAFAFKSQPLRANFGAERKAAARHPVKLNSLPYRLRSRGGLRHAGVGARRSSKRKNSTDFRRGRHKRRAK